MSSIHEHPAALVAAILDEHLEQPAEHLPQGQVPTTPDVPTLRVRELLAPAPRYSWRGGRHVLTVQLQSAAPDHSNVLESLPTISEQEQLPGSQGTIVTLEILSEPTRALHAGIVTNSVRAKVTVSERAPLLQGVPFDWRLQEEGQRLGEILGAVEVRDVLSGTRVPERGSAEATLRAEFVLPASTSPYPEVAHYVKQTLEGLRKSNVYAIGNLRSAKVEQPMAEMRDGRRHVVVPVRVAYGFRV